MPPKNTHRLTDRLEALLSKYCKETAQSKNSVIVDSVLEFLRHHYGAEFVRDWLAEGEPEEPTEE